MDRNTLKNILKFLSVAGMAVGFFFAVCVATGMYYHERIGAFAAFVGGMLAINGLIFFRLRRYEMRMRLKEGILAVNAVWMLLALSGAIALMLMTHISLADGFFEAMSGFTTTGATIYGDIETLPHTVLMLRSMMHWLGGMGVIVLGVGLFSLINPSGSLALFKAESTGVSLEKVTPKIRDTALRLWLVYGVLTLADAIALKLAGMGWFDAINHAMSTISTGGFSTKNASLGAYDSYAIVWITTFFMIVSGINFLAHLKVATTGSFSGYKREEVMWYIGLIAVLSIILSGVDAFLDSDTWFHAVTHATFTIASVMTTTGFATLDYAQWGHVAIAVIFVAMLLGGNAGSTAGGVKIVRYIILFKNLSAQFVKTLHPRAMVGVFIDKKRVGGMTIASVTGFILLFVLSNMAVALYLFASGYDAMTSVSTALATLGNIGPGFALTGPAENYAFFTDTQKWVLSFAMMAGRLEFYTLFLLLSRSFWKRF
jgi:trk system potassium uptake protein TrkH